MAWTSPKTWSVAEKVTAALMNLHLRDNLNWLRGVLDGTGADNVTFPVNARALTSFMIGNADDNFRLIRNGANPQITLDSGTDMLLYDRATNTLNYYVGGVIQFSINATGVISGNAATTQFAKNVAFSNDAAFAAEVSGGNPLLRLDSSPSDFLFYTRSTNTLSLVVNGVTVWSLASTGKQAGAGYYDSGEVAIGGGASVAVSHGLGARPRFLGGYWFSSTGNLADSSTTNVWALQSPQFGAAQTYLSWADNTQISLTNGAGGTSYFRVFAIL